MAKKKEEIETLKETKKTTVKKAVPKKTMAKLPSRDEYIYLRSIAEGEVIYDSRLTGLETVWSEYGEVQEVQFAELPVMKSRRKFLEKWLIVEQGYMEEEQYELVVKHLGLEKLYQDLGLLQDMDSLFELSAEEIEQKLNDFPKGIKESIGERALKKVNDNELYDIRKINAIQRVLKIDLTL